MIISISQRIKSLLPYTRQLLWAHAICIILVGTVFSQDNTSNMKNAEFEIGKNQIISRLELNQSTVTDAVRLIAEIAGINVAATTDAGSREISIFLRHIRAIDAIETICKVSGLWYRSESEIGLIRIMTTTEYGKDLVIYREDDTKVFTLLHPNVFSIGQHIQDLYGDRVLLSLPRFMTINF